MIEFIYSTGVVNLSSPPILHEDALHSKLSAEGLGRWKNVPMMNTCLEAKRTQWGSIQGTIRNIYVLLHLHVYTVTIVASKRGTKRLKRKILTANMRSSSRHKIVP